MAKDTPTIDINRRQIQNVLYHVDQHHNTEVKKDIFCKLGTQCFYDTGLDKWIEDFGGDYQRLMDDINGAGQSPYWEHLELNAEKTKLQITGRRVSQCACILGQTEQPNTSLCRYCCRSLQEKMFGTLFERPVEVEITESYLLGGSRCSTVIHLK